MDDSGPAVLAPSKKAAKRAARRAEKVARRAAHQQKERAAQAAAASAASDGIMEITLTAKDESGAGPAVLCAFIIPNKHRGCKRPPLPGKQFCGNHAHFDAECARKRVPCPIDPTHTVWADALEKHLKVCSTAKKRATVAAQMEAESLAQPYYVPNYNCINGTPPSVHASASSDGDDASSATTSDAGVTSSVTSVDKHNEDPRPGMGVNALRWLRAAVLARDHHFGGATFPTLLGSGVAEPAVVGGGGNAASVVDAVDAASVGSAAADEDGKVSDANNDDYDDDADDGGRGGGAGAGEPNDPTGKRKAQARKNQQQQQGGGVRSAKAAKHAAQEEAVIEHLRAAQMLQDAAALCFVEFGAAQGGLGQAVRNALPGSTVVLVERDVYGPKTDRFWLTPEEQARHRTTAAMGSALAVKRDFARARVDIRHLDVGQLPLVSGRPVVAVAKHLCGVATDLTLTALKNRMDQKQHSVGGVMICTCCHALMKWEDYPDASRRWLSEVVGSTVEKQEFELLRRCTGWQNDGGHTAATSKTLSKRAAARQALKARADEEVAAGVVGGLATTELEQELQDAAAARAGREWRAGIDDDERETIGRCCKQLLDGGRRAAVRASGLRCELVQYIDTSVTPENTLLVAWDATLCAVDLFDK